MSSLVRVLQLGNMRFGIPEDIEELRKPWAFYDYLGIPRNASQDVIGQAYRRMAQKLHTDAGGKKEQFQVLENVREVLLDDGRPFGPEHGRRAHYDSVCELDDFFDGFIEYRCKRTMKFSELLLAEMEAKRSIAKFEHKMAEEVPGFAEKLRSLKTAKSEEVAEALTAELGQLMEQHSEIDPEAREQHRKLREEQIQQSEKQTADFIETARKNRGVFSPVADIYYVGGNSFVFTDDGSSNFGIVEAGENNGIASMVVSGDYCKICGVRQVHFKSKKAVVQVKDPSLSGIVHVLDGTVRVVYESSTYGEVIRVRAPKIEWFDGFVKHGELFVPQKFAVGSWWEKKPALDIAVKTGSASLTLRSPAVMSQSYYPYNYPYIIGGLGSILNNKYTSSNSSLETLILLPKPDKSNKYRC